ncbi:phage terminase large subunit [Bacillus sp. SM2101]|uniref:phage terminase large subunit n=1 Tax=Bacillus sp. SM2101 TaxID=2805366 RepID=UPI001BDF17CE|nr:phage terminase large subunit [Bacillus sp. SM2101]
MNDQQLKLLYHYLHKHFDDDEIEDLLNNHPLTGENGLRRMLGEIDPMYFCKAYIPSEFTKEFGEYAKEILTTLKDSIESDRQENVCVICPREHGKSTMSSVATPVYSALYDKKKFILFISANADTAQNFLAKVKRTLENAEITEDFGKQRDKKRTWNADEIETSNGVWIACSGWKAGIRGMNKPDVGRPDLICLDDLEDKDTIASDSLRKKLEGAFRDEIGRLGTHTTDMFYIGTLLAEDSLLAKVMNEPSWDTLFYQCVTSFSDNEELWDEWRKVYRDRTNENRKDEAYEFYLNNKADMLEGANVLWDGRFPSDEVRYEGAYYNVMLNREKWGETSFWKEDQNEPRSSKEFIFKDLLFWEELPKFEEMDIVCSVDPSMGKKDGDYSGITVIGKHKVTGYKYVIEGIIEKLHPSKLIKRVVDLCKKYPITTIGFESVAFQEYVADDLKKMLKEKELYHVLVKPKSSRSNKFERIVNLEPFITRGEILFNQSSLAYNAQIKEFRNGCKNDDAADSLQLGFELVEKIKPPRRIINKPEAFKVHKGRRKLFARSRL